MSNFTKYLIKILLIGHYNYLTHTVNENIPVTIIELKFFSKSGPWSGPKSLRLPHKQGPITLLKILRII